METTNCYVKGEPDGEWTGQKHEYHTRNRETMVINMKGVKKARVVWDDRRKKWVQVVIKKK